MLSRKIALLASTGLALVLLLLFLKEEVSDLDDWGAGGVGHHN